MAASASLAMVVPQLQPAIPASVCSTIGGKNEDEPKYPTGLAAGGGDVSVRVCPMWVVIVAVHLLIVVLREKGFFGFRAVEGWEQGWLCVRE